MGGRFLITLSSNELNSIPMQMSKRKGRGPEHYNLLSNASPMKEMRPRREWRLRRRRVGGVTVRFPLSPGTVDPCIAMLTSPVLVDFFRLTSCNLRGAVGE